MNLAEAHKIVERLQAAWPHKNWSEQSPSAYLTGLADLEYSTVDAAVDEAIKISKFAPSPAELRAMTPEQRIPNLPHYPPLQPRAERLEDIERWFANGILKREQRDDLMMRLERQYRPATATA